MAYIHTYMYMCIMLIAMGFQPYIPKEAGMSASTWEGYDPDYEHKAILKCRGQRKQRKILKNLCEEHVCVRTDVYLRIGHALNEYMGEPTYYRCHWSSCAQQEEVKALDLEVD